MNARKDGEPVPARSREDARRILAALARGVDAERLLERIASREDAEALRAALLEVGAAMLTGRDGAGAGDGLTRRAGPVTLDQTPTR